MKIRSGGNGEFVVKIILFPQGSKEISNVVDYCIKEITRAGFTEMLELAEVEDRG
jgi:hypothetical protein